MILHQILEKRVLSAQGWTNEQYHQFQFNQISLETKFYLKQKVLIFRKKSSRKVHFPPKAWQLNITTELSIFELV